MAVYHHVVKDVDKKGGGLMEGKVAAAVEGERGDDAGARAVTEARRLLGEVSEQERIRALERFVLLRPCLEEGVSLAQVARTHGIALKNVQRWMQQYRREGLVGLARRRRSDRGKRRGIPLECVHLIEGLARPGSQALGGRDSSSGVCRGSAEGLACAELWACLR
jgi:Helix-turn-helix domain